MGVRSSVKNTKLVLLRRHPTPLPNLRSDNLYSNIQKCYPFRLETLVTSFTAARRSNLQKHSSYQTKCRLCLPYLVTVTRNIIGLCFERSMLAMQRFCQQVPATAQNTFRNRHEKLSRFSYKVCQLISVKLIQCTYLEGCLFTGYSKTT